MVRSSPRASAGFRRFAASPVPAAPPAPISVCASSMKRMTGTSEACTSSITARRRFSNSPLTLAPACIRPTSSIRRLTPCSIGGTSPCGDAQREALDHRGLAHARLAGQDRVVLPPPHQDVDDLADLGVAADHRVDLARPRPLGQVGGVARQRRIAAGRAPRRRVAALGRRRRAPALDRAREHVLEPRADRVGVDLVELGADLAEQAVEHRHLQAREQDVARAHGLVAELAASRSSSPPGWRGRCGRRTPRSRSRRRAAGRSRGSCRRPAASASTPGLGQDQLHVAAVG